MPLSGLKTRPTCFLEVGHRRKVWGTFFWQKREGETQPGGHRLVPLPLAMVIAIDPLSP